MSAVLAAECHGMATNEIGEGQQEIRPASSNEVVDVEARRLRMRLQIAGDNWQSRRRLSRRLVSASVVGRARLDG